MLEVRMGYASKCCRWNGFFLAHDNFKIPVSFDQFRVQRGNVVLEYATCTINLAYLSDAKSHVDVTKKETKPLSETVNRRIYMYM